MPGYARSSDGAGGYKIVAQMPEATVVAAYEPLEQNSTHWQTEAELEEALLAQLERQGFERVRITSEEGLIPNLRAELERLNRLTFSDDEWGRLWREFIAHGGDGIDEKCRRIQEDWIYPLRRDDGTTVNVALLDKGDIYRNHLQVLNQYEADAGTYKSRYDVTVLVNGLPLVHLELKRRGVAIKEAFNQIRRYQRQSFWSESGLFEYVQVFVISNGTYTKYYSNTTRVGHLQEVAGRRGRKVMASRSFEFTSWWADAANRPIPDLMDFARTFMARHTLLAVLCRFCVHTTSGDLMVMRPYQIAACERILNRVLVSENDRRRLGTADAGGYVWHTTGSGKTLTSFKCAQLAVDMEGVDKVLFVVDRKDLDQQTKVEFERFQKDAVNSNKSTKELEAQLGRADVKIIVTTVQKLATFIGRVKEHSIYSQHVVIIFDECHRSQFGKMHRDITRAFCKYHIFGFTGTPIFAANASTANPASARTTQQLFGDQLHSYTIIDAIRDGNVLPFRVDYLNTARMKDDVAMEQVSAIDREKALLEPKRIEANVTYLLDHFDQKTKRGERYREGQRQLNGFNSILACQSIPAAKRYYAEVKRQCNERARDFRMAMIYSWAPNADQDDADLAGFMPDEDFDASMLDADDRTALALAIEDYNWQFGTNYSTEGDGFEGYYHDVAKRMRNREIDLLVVVNMFLTGFDAKTLNTLWVDKNLRLHGLIQAFSRTNRILNSVKTFGNIVCFRNLESQVNDALALFGDPDSCGNVVLKPYAEYREAYGKALAHLRESYPDPAQIAFVGEELQKAFIELWNSILRLRNILECFDEFAGDDPLADFDRQNYMSSYTLLYSKFRPRGEAVDVSDDIVFEVELVKSVDINIDFILELIASRRGQGAEDREVRAEVLRAVGGSLALHDKRDLIEAFLDTLDVDLDAGGDMHQAWRLYVDAQRAAELDAIIEDEGLRADETRAFMEAAFRDGEVRRTGTEVVELLPPVSRFSPTAAGDAVGKKARVLDRLEAFFRRFFDVS